MKTNVRRWFTGIGRGFISGGAGAVTSSGMVAIIDPDKVSPMLQSWHFVSLMFSVFVVNGLLHLFIYLQQHPLPDDTDSNPQAFVKPPDNPAQPTKQ